MVWLNAMKRSRRYFCDQKLMLLEFLPDEAFKLGMTDEELFVYRSVCTYELIFLHATRFQELRPKKYLKYAQKKNIRQIV